MKNKFLGILSRLEFLIPALLFLTMLISCGLFLNIKMNGKSTGLPGLPEKEIRLLMRSDTSENTDFDEDLIEPVFVGVKNDNAMIAAIPDDTTRRSIENIVYAPLLQLFSGIGEEKVFNSPEEKEIFIENIKNGREYILISFYSDIPSSAFLPCIVSSFDVESHEDVFNIRHLFLLPDSSDNLFAVAMSSERDVNVIYPAESIPFSKINIETYDISEGWAHFEFPFYGDVTAEISDSVSLGKYHVSSASTLYGKDVNAGWISDCFDVFSLNVNLVKSFASGDGAIVNHVEETSELIVSDDGFVEYKALDGVGVYLDEFLGYAPNEGSNYSFSDKIFALKKILNELDIHNDNISYSFSDFEHEESSNTLKVHFKLFSDGILLTDSRYDAVFEFSGNNLVYAKYMAVVCSEVNERYTLMPQKYANVLLRSESEYNSGFDVYCPIMIDEVIDEEISGFKVVDWAKVSSSLSEVNG